MDLTLAYFDPSAGSLLLQALVGGFGGIAVLMRYLLIKVTQRGSSIADGSGDSNRGHDVSVRVP